MKRGRAGWGLKGWGRKGAWGGEEGGGGGEGERVDRESNEEGR